MRRVLLTGFEPFGGSATNVSAIAVERLRADIPHHIELHTAILPVDAQRGPEQIAAAICALRPDDCLMLGQADGYTTLTVERVAINLCDFRIPDNAGIQLSDHPVSPDGPDAYFATLPTRQLVVAAQFAGVPTSVSLSAGAFLCNMVFYAALHTCALQQLPTRCGFVHLPLLPTQVFTDSRPHPTMAIETIVTGLRAMLNSLDDTANPVTHALAM